MPSSKMLILLETLESFVVCNVAFQYCKFGLCILEQDVYALSSLKDSITLGCITLKLSEVSQIIFANDVFRISFI